MGDIRQHQREGISRHKQPQRWNFRRPAGQQLTTDRALRSSQPKSVGPMMTYADSLFQLFLEQFTEADLSFLTEHDLSAFKNKPGHE